jgi:hypothetical protein
MYIEKQSIQVEVLIKKASFFGAKADIPKELGDRIFKLQDDMREVQDYLGVIKNGTKLEVPKCLEEPVTPVAAKGKQPKRKASEATSNSKSRKKSSSVEESTSTSQTTQE